MIAALLIFVIAGVIAAAIGGLVARTMGDTPTGKIVGSVVPVLVMAIATFMILNQLQIATEIVTITYAALIGGVFLAMALAFGLGGREVAGRMLADAYDIAAPDLITPLPPKRGRGANAPYFVSKIPEFLIRTR